MWKVLWISRISTGCRNQAACCLVACYHKNKRLIVKSHNFRDFDNECGLLRAFFLLLLFSFFFFSLKPNLLVQLLFWELQFLLLQRKESENLRNVSAGPERSCTRRAWVHCERALLPCCLQTCGFWQLALLYCQECNEQQSWAGLLHGIKAWLQKNQASPKPQVLRRFDAKLLVLPSGFPLGFACVFPPEAVSVFCSGDKQ